MLTQDILVCLEQKKILMEQILNVTKQMEVQSLEETIDLDRLLEQRGQLMQRVDKCNILIQARIAEQSAPEQEHLNSLLALQLHTEDCSPDEKTAIHLLEQINLFFDQAASLNRSTLDILLVQHEEAKKHLSELKAEREPNNLFSFL